MKRHQYLHEWQSTVMIHNIVFKLPVKEVITMTHTIKEFIEKLKESGQSIPFYYEDRDAEYPEENVFRGKWGECALNWYLITNWHFPKIGVDFAIRYSHKKGWIVDLDYNNADSRYKNIHVKTSAGSTVKIAGEKSWMFQNTDPLVKDPKCTDMVVFMHYDYIKKEYTFVASAPWNLIHKYLREPVLDKYKETKTCIYLSDLVAIANERVAA